MTDNMQRARELLLERYLSRGHTDESAELRVRHIERHEPAAMQAIAAALRLAVPEGFVVVPREPTESMVEAICAAHAAGGWPDGYGKHAQGLHRAHAQIGYRAMLAAAPKPEDS